jgi:pectate lyase
MYQKKLIRTLFSATVAALVAVSLQAADGFGRNATGGAGGANVTATTAAQLKSYAESATTYTITVSGTIDVNATGTAVKVKSNKTIKGANTSATIKGCLDLNSGGVNNVIIQNLKITNPGGDGISLMNCTNVFVTKCEIYDCADGLCDIGDRANNITVSWCKFHYPSQADHRFSMILGRSTDPTGFLRVTLHHNWWGNRCDQRMPSGSNASAAHLYNNYFNCSGNYYCSDARAGSNWLVQNSYYQSVRNPLAEQGGGKIKSTGNTFSNCTGSINVATGAGFTPSYGYTLDPTANVPTRVQGGAGNR